MELRGIGKPICAAIGVFDGVHLGHQQVIQRMILDARAHAAQTVVITFDRHPQSVVHPQSAPQLIYTLAHKLKTLASLGADATLLYHFDLEFSRQPAEEFVGRLVHECGTLRSLSVGTNFFFGHQRRGNLALLQELGARHGFNVNGLEPINNHGLVLSSTRIRQHIQTGQLADASQMLGRPYSVFSKVQMGDQLGRKLGFPTANLDILDLLLPPLGVYTAHVLWQNKTYPAVLNLGNRPTLASPTPLPRLEVHLLDFTGDLYGQELEVIFGQKIREESKFASLAALQTQITCDVARAREILLK